MTEPKSESPVLWPDWAGAIPNHTIFYLDDDEGDYTVKPIPPERMARALAEREKILQALARRKEQLEAEKSPPPPDGPAAPG